MFRHWPWLRAFFFLCSGGWLWATPPLTTVQDTLYKADGSRFTGTLLIEWSTFQASDFSTITNQSLRVTVIDGQLRVQLVPTTDAKTADAHYTVRYISSSGLDGIERWYVPPSSGRVTIATVRNPSATGNGDTPNSGSVTVAITDVTGLSAELAARPQKGPGFTVGRTAVVNANGQLETAGGNLADCVHVDGSSAPCATTTGTGTGTGSNSAGPGFVDSEIPAGVINGSNPTFTLANTPVPSGSLALHRNGVLQSATLDYTVAGNVITFGSGSLPQAGDSLLAFYRLSAAADAAGGGTTVSDSTTLNAPQVLCSAAGAATGNTTMTRLGSCSIAGTVLAPGDRLEIRYDYLHNGTGTGTEIALQFAGTTFPSRLLNATEPRLAGRIEISFSNDGVYWSGESWGSSTNLTAQAGTLAFGGGNVMVELDGRLTSSSGDQLRLGHFTVVRYPGRVNP